jgi:predicted DNA-binding antitoxin AbrB/MazE fold protein
MDSFTIQATYEKGVLKPRKKLNLPERAIVEIQVRSVYKARRDATAFASLIGVWENLPTKKYNALEKKLTQTRKKSSAKVKRLAKKIK